MPSLASAASETETSGAWVTETDSGALANPSPETAEESARAGGGEPSAEAGDAGIGDAQPASAPIPSQTATSDLLVPIQTPTKHSAGEVEKPAEAMEPLASVCADASSAVVDKMNVYRLFNPSSAEHLYTSDFYEAMTIASAQGWQYEGIGFTASGSSGTPVYRLYSPACGLHLWTTDANEKRELSIAKHEWNYEGVAWFGVKGFHMRRLYDPASGQHLYTRDSNEVAELTSRCGWREEPSAGTWDTGDAHDYVPVEPTWLVSSSWGNGEQRYWIQSDGSIAKGTTLSVGGVEYVADVTGAALEKSEYDFVNTWAHRIDAYMAAYPLAGQGRNFAQAAYEHGLDPRLSAAIASLESTRGKYCFRPHNAWGWTGKSFSSWREAIWAHVRYLATSGYYGFAWGPYGRKFTERDAQTYSGGYYGVAYLERFMRDIWA